jgi:hypothetical protein
MARLIPNENTWVGFAPAASITNIAAPTAAQVAAAENLTPLLISLNASSRGNTVPTPSFDTLFETSTTGTSAATFDADFYRDDEDDAAWELLQRGVRGFFLISRFGGTGTNNLPVATDEVEVWPVTITSRSMANMSNNTVLTFTVSCAVTKEPAEDAVVAA